MDYLRWYRAVLALPVSNGHRVTDLLPHADGTVELRIEAAGAPAARLGAPGRARHRPRRPRRPGGARLRPSRLPRARWAHSSDDNDYAALRGLRVGVVGAGASAMDSAATALEAGAAQVHLLVRRPDLPRINKGKGAGNPGFVQGYARLPGRLEMAHPPLHQHAAGAAAAQQHPARLAPSATRTSTSASRSWRRGARRRAAAPDLGRPARARLPDLRHRLQASTGGSGRCCATSRRTSALWKDRYRPPPDADDAELAESPDLGAAFEFQPRAGAHCPGLERLHCFCYPATLSLGVITGDIPAISEGALQLADRLAGLLYVEDIEHHFARIEAFAEPEVFGDEWVAEPLPPRTLTHHLEPDRIAMNDPDVIDRAAGLAPGDPLHAAGAFAPRSSTRPRRATTRCLMQPVPGLSPADRLRVAVLPAKPPARRPSPATTPTCWRATTDRRAPPSPALPAMLRFAATADDRPAPQRPRGHRSR